MSMKQNDETQSRWYMVNKDGMCTLCADQADAEQVAKDAQEVWPHMGPHRAVQLSESFGAWFTAADMATASAQGFRDGQAEQAVVAAGWEFPALTPELAKILGTMCFQCITFSQALRQAGHQITTRAEDEQAATLHWMLGHYFRHGEDAAAKLLALNDPPTAVFAVSDRLAIGAMRTFKRKGRRIPLDIAVIGFDNTPFGEYSEPALTTVAQPARELGAQALRMLGDVLEGRPVQSLTLPHRLILRDSA